MMLHFLKKHSLGLRRFVSRRSPTADCADELSLTPRTVVATFAHFRHRR
jgi:hypothetical protein